MSRGEPWFHSTLRTLHDSGGYEEAVVVKARAAANVVGFIKATEPLAPDDVDKLGRELIDTEPGTWQRLLPGEDVAGFNAAQPDPAVEPFLRLMLRKFAIGVGISYESASRDYSQSNYSGSRMGLIDDRDNYRVLQGWICRKLRQNIHREFLDAAALVGELRIPDYFVDPKKYGSVRYKPRGWTWIDPAKEVAAYKMAVRSGFMTQADVIAQTANGADLEDVLIARADELEAADELGLVFDSNPAQVNDKGADQGAPAPAGLDPKASGDAAGGGDAGSADAGTDANDDTQQEGDK
jgi:lambda family phage portal protein